MKIFTRNNFQPITARWQRMQVHVQKRPHLMFIIGLIAFVVFSIISNHQHNTATPTPSSPSSESPDTLIPKGFVLVPVELRNADSLSALIDNFAIVDLYVASNSGQGHGQRVGHRLRLLRAPLNPNTFAVLVPDSEANSIVNGSGPLIAVIQNRNQIGNGDLEKSEKKKNHVQYYIGG